MSETFWQRWCCGVRRTWQRPDWLELVGTDWADRIMQTAVTDRFHAKQGRSTGRWILDNNGRRLAVYLKRHYRLPRWQGLMATLRPAAGLSPAFQEWRHLQWAQDQGIPVPHAVAVAEYVGPWGRLQSCLAVEELVDMLPLNEAIPQAATSLGAIAFCRWKAELIVEIARLARALHQRHHFHKDFYLCHFYVHRDDARGACRSSSRVHLIDLHRLTARPWMAVLGKIKDLGQLLYSSEVPGVTPRDRLRFWRAYLGCDRPNLTARCLGWMVRLKGRSYRRHRSRSRAPSNGCRPAPRTGKAA